MKKSKYLKPALLFLLLAILAILLVRCEKEPIVVPKYTVEVIALGSGGVVIPSGVFEVKEGDSLRIIIKPNVGYVVDSIIVDGVSISFSENTYTISNVFAPAKVKVVFKITPFGLLIDKPWELCKWQSRPVAETTEWYTRPLQKKETYVFYYDEIHSECRFVKFWDQQRVGDGYFILTPDSLYIGCPRGGPDGDGYECLIIQLTKDTLVLKDYVYCYGSDGQHVHERDMYVQKTYKH